MTLPTAQTNDNDRHRKLLHASGLAPQTFGTSVEDLVIDPKTLAHHKLIQYDAFVLPVEVLEKDERTLVVVVDRIELEREGYTDKTLKDRLDEILIPKVELVVRD